MEIPEFAHPDFSVPGGPLKPVVGGSRERSQPLLSLLDSPCYEVLFKLWESLC